MRKIILSVILCAFVSFCYGQDFREPLTKNQKLADFEYLYNELEASYPYFGINERVYKVDWLSNKDKYAKIIHNSNNDTTFVRNLNYIISQLHNGHTGINPTLWYDYYYQVYKKNLEEYPKLQAYLDELEKSSPEQCKYWYKLMEDKEEEESIQGENSTEVAIDMNTDNISAQFSEENETMLVSIKSFDSELIAEDSSRVKGIFKEAHSYKNLIIDIRGNVGGDTRYWSEYIVPYLTAKDITYPTITAFKDSERVRNFKPSYKSNSNIEDFKFTQVPKEISEEGFKIMADMDTIEAKLSTPNRNQKIYLLTDRAVYSSAETLAYFCKSTGFAQIIGEKTGGDGIGTDPLLLTLPNSGIVISFTGEMALNPDGSANEEKQTEPDFVSQRILHLADIEDIYDEILKTQEK